VINNGDAVGTDSVNPVDSSSELRPTDLQFEHVFRLKYVRLSRVGGFEKLLKLFSALSQIQLVLITIWDSGVGKSLSQLFHQFGLANLSVHAWRIVKSPQNLMYDRAIM